LDIKTNINACFKFIFLDGNVHQELVACLGEHDLQTINPTTAANIIAEYLQLDTSSIEPPADVKKCRSFCIYLKDKQRHDIVRELRTILPASGMTGW
jgi:chemotaxis methyl-accepting protein methylase